MYDHVAITVSDLGASRAFYDAVFEALGFSLDVHSGRDDSEWEQLAIGRRADRPVTRRLHVALGALEPEDVDAFHRAALAAGGRDNGPPGLRLQYHPDYYGAFVLDPDGNNVEAVHHGRPPRFAGCVDHVSLRVRDLQASVAFYDTVAPAVGIERVRHEEEEAGYRGGGSTFWLVPGEPTENVHLAFGVGDNAAVDEFHRLAVTAGHRDNGPPGERAVYHRGYYGAFVLDPDGNNVEAVNHNRP